MPNKTAQQTRRRVMAALKVAATIVVIIGGGCACLWEYLAYNEDISSCYSDNMWVLRCELEAFVNEHDGEMPASFDELRAYMKSKGLGPHDICVRADAPFIWMPPGVTAKDGRPGVLMCPPNSHGWLRKYAFGLVRDGDSFRFVRVRGNRATPFR
jgi:hypothetical protein